MNQIPKVTLAELDVLVGVRVMDLPIGGAESYPLYSRDIAAAWTVVDKLCADGYTFELEQFPGWRATFDAELTTSSESGEADECPTAPVAICLAALGTWSITVELIDSLAQGATDGAPPQTNPEFEESGEKVCLNS